MLAVKMFNLEYNHKVKVSQNRLLVHHDGTNVSCSQFNLELSELSKAGKHRSVEPTKQLSTGR
jgi:uncharacterized lipoprotein YmbA